MAGNCIRLRQLSRIRSMRDVLFVSMPFGPVFTPSIGLSLLQAQLARAEIASDIRYFSIPFADRLGSRLYTAISQSQGIPITDLAGEWIFSRALTDRPDDDAAAYVDGVLNARSDWARRNQHAPMKPAFARRIARARSLVPPFLDWCVREIAAASPRIVGLTSSFQQQAPSLALARRLKQA